MAIVTFTLSEEGVAVLQSALTCINKFSDDVSLEARKDKVRTPPFLGGGTGRWVPRTTTNAPS